MERKLCPLSIASRRGTWAIPGVQELDKEVPRGTQARAGTRHTSCHRGASGLAQPREAGQGPPSCPPADFSRPSRQA